MRVKDITRYIYIFIFKIVEKKKLKVKGEQYEEIGLYNSSFEHDACGIGAVVNIKGKKSHDVIDNCFGDIRKLET